MMYLGKKVPSYGAVKESEDGKKIKEKHMIISTPRKNRCLIDDNGNKYVKVAYNGMVRAYPVTEQVLPEHACLFDDKHGKYKFLPGHAPKPIDFGEETEIEEIEVFSGVKIKTSPIQIVDYIKMLEDKYRFEVEKYDVRFPVIRPFYNYYSLVTTDTNRVVNRKCNICDVLDVRDSDPKYADIKPLLIPEDGNEHHFGNDLYLKRFNEDFVWGTHFLGKAAKAFKNTLYVADFKNNECVVIKVYPPKHENRSVSGDEVDGFDYFNPLHHALIRTSVLRVRSTRRVPL